MTQFSVQLRPTVDTPARCESDDTGDAVSVPKLNNAFALKSSTGME